MSRSSMSSRLLPAVALSTALLTACSDVPTGPGGDVREVGIVVNSIDVSLTLFDVEDPSSTRTVGLGPDGSPVSVAVRGAVVAVPLGIVPAVAIVDAAAGQLVRTIALPAGSGATGAAFVNDSIVLVANPGLNTVSPVNVRSGAVLAPIDVGRYPQAIVARDGRAYVLNAELASWVPDGPSTLTVLNGSTLEVIETLDLGGENASAGAFDEDGLLYVVHSGSFGAADGALSVVDPGLGEEVSFHPGFGEFPGSVALGADGLVYVGAFGVGTSVWDPAGEAFVHAPASALAPAGVASTSGLAVDSEGRVYAATPDCQGPAEIHRLGAAFEVEASVPVGICPAAIAFTEIEEGR